MNGDTVSSFTVGFAPPQSSVLAVGTYSVVPTLSGGDAATTITAKPASLIVTKAPVAVSIAAAKTQVANTAAGVASATFSISVSTAVTEGKGVPSGTVTVTDVFTPITVTGLGTAQAPQTSSVSLVAGFGTYTPTNIASGMHQYSFTYNGDTNFQTATVALPVTAAACTPSNPSTNCLVVDTPDFTLTSTTGRSKLILVRRQWQRSACGTQPEQYISADCSSVRQRSSVICRTDQPVLHTSESGLCELLHDAHIGDGCSVRDGYHGCDCYRHLDAGNGTARLQLRYDYRSTADCSRQDSTGVPAVRSLGILRAPSAQVEQGVVDADACLRG